MSQFAKLFQFADIGQVLVKKDTGADEPELRFYFKPKQLGVCSVAISFKGSTEEAQWDAVDAAFERTDENRAHEIVLDALRAIPGGLCA